MCLFVQYVYAYINIQQLNPIISNPIYIYIYIIQVYIQIIANISMDHQTLEHIYLNYQPQQYYHKYLKDNKIRQDSRQLTQHRNIRISASTASTSNSITISRGNTIVIAQLSTNVEQVVYSPVSESYGKQLISLQVSVALGTGRYAKIDRNASRAVEAFVDQFIDWKHIQKQLVYQNVDKATLHAHTGTITIRIADSDGCLEETALLAVQMLLLTAKFNQYTSTQNNNNKQTKDKNTTFSLKLEQFWFPIKYCEILDQLIIDPSKRQEEASNYQLTLITDLKAKQDKRKPFRILNVHKNGSLSQQTIVAIEKLYETQLSKLALNLEQFQIKCKNGQTVLTISNI